MSTITLIYITLHPVQSHGYLLNHSSINSKSTLKFVNTSMHGVGHLAAVTAFEAFGLPPFTAVKKQQEPDPEFPTVKFPNPEEQGWCFTARILKMTF